MKICGQCGAQNDDMALNCFNCGANLYQDMNMAYGQPYGNPGAVGYNGGAAYGNPGAVGYNGEQPYAAPQDCGNGGTRQAKPRGNKGWLIGCIVGAVVILLIVVIVLVVQKNKQDKMRQYANSWGVAGSDAGYTDDSGLDMDALLPFLSGASSPEQVAEQFINAMNEQDVDKLANLCPPFLDPGKDELQSMIDMYSGYDVTFTYEGVESKEEYTDSDLKELQEDVSDYAETDVKLDASCDLEFSFNVAVTMLGETYDESSTYMVTCIKYRGRWYLYE